MEEYCPPDCQERTNCPIVGGVGHWFCGTCPEHDQPRHHCGCAATTLIPNTTNEENTMPENYFTETTETADVQEIPQHVNTARDYRKKAQILLRGKSGLTEQEKIDRLVDARDALEKAITLMETGEVD